MKVVIDACVLYPTVLREIVLGVARGGAFTPLWSARILEEWRRAADKIGPEGRVQAEAEIALLRAAWPEAEQPPAPELEARLWLPDRADIHVLAVAVAAGADAIMTLNLRDFPERVLAEHGLARLAPDSYLRALWERDPGPVEEVAATVLGVANRMSGRHWEMRGLLKKARLPRLAKALEGIEGR